MQQIVEERKLQEEKAQEDKYLGLSKEQIKKRKKKEKEKEKKKEKEKEKDSQKDKDNLEQSKQEKGKDKKKGKEKQSAAAKLYKQRMEKLGKFRDQQKKIQQEEKQRQEAERLQRELKQKKEQEEKDRLKRQKQQLAKQKAKDGLKMSKKQQQKFQKMRAQLAEMQTSQPNKKQDIPVPINKIYTPVQKVKELEQQKQTPQNLSKYIPEARQKVEYPELRSIICCILGHVDTGKTTLLDKIRKTNVQENQEGGITQQIGATFFPRSKLQEQVAKCKEFMQPMEMPPGLLIIDTPGHQSFANLRSRGNSLCDIAILVIDQMHGLQKQTLQSLQLLRSRNTPFVVALNKIDRNYEWVPKPMQPSFLSLQQQNQTARFDFQHRLQKVQLQLKSHGYNPALYWRRDEQDQIHLVPTSGVTGQGIPDLLTLLVKRCTEQQNIRKKIKFNTTNFKCTVMQKKMIEGYGTTVDCMLVDGIIHKDDTIVLLGFNGAITTKVKSILTPHPMKEMRVKGEYLLHEQIWGANGVKLSAKDLDLAVAGTPLFVVHNQEEQAQAKIICQAQLHNIKKNFKLSPLGVGVASSTLGSLEALLEYLRTVKIPVSYVSVGPVSKQDVMLAMKSVLAQSPDQRKEQFACMLVFDIKVLPDAQKYAQQNNIRIFNANIIYHLTDMFEKFVAGLKQERKQKNAHLANFPCILKGVAFFRRADPIVMGVDVVDGVLKVGTKICTYNKDKVQVGFVQSIQSNHKSIKEARKQTGSVAVKINSKCLAGREFQISDRLCSKMTRQSIDILKQHFREEMTMGDWSLVKTLRDFFGVEKTG